MKFDIYGPFTAPRQRNGLLTRNPREKRLFWAALDQLEPGLSAAVGCYVISVRNVVWYVGLAAKQSFADECFALHKVTKFDEAITEGRGNAELHLLAKRTNTGRLAKPSKNGHPDAALLEDYLIAFGLKRNENFLNKRDTAILRDLQVPGFFNTKQGQARALPVQHLKRVMGI